MSVPEGSPVVIDATAYAERQDDWSDARRRLFVSFMNYLAGSGYQVGRVQDYMQSFKRLLLWFEAIGMVAVPGCLSYDQAFRLMTTSYIQSWLD